MAISFKKKTVRIQPLGNYNHKNFNIFTKINLKGFAEIVKT